MRGHAQLSRGVVVETSRSAPFDSAGFVEIPINASLTKSVDELKQAVRGATRAHTLRAPDMPLCSCVARPPQVMKSGKMPTYHYIVSMTFEGKTLLEGATLKQYGVVSGACIREGKKQLHRVRAFV